MRSIRNPFELLSTAGYIGAREVSRVSSLRTPTSSSSPTMATTDALPVLSTEASEPVATPYDEKKSSTAASFDEKGDIKVLDPKEAVDILEVDDVYTDGPRLIDLGEDGKERPIGMYSPACLAHSHQLIYSPSHGRGLCSSPPVSRG